MLGERRAEKPIPVNDMMRFAFMDDDVKKNEQLGEGQAERILRLTQSAVNNTPESIFWLRQNGRFHYINDQACSLTGYSREEILSMAIFDIDPELSVEEWSRLWEKRKSLLPVTFASHQRAKNGKVFPVEVRAGYLSHDNAEYLCAIVRDVTERKRTEETIRASEQNLRLVFNGVHDAIFIHDIDGTILDVNNKMLEMYGVTREQALTLPGEAFSADGRPLNNVQNLWESILKGENHLFEWKAQRPNDGSIFDVEVFLTTLYMNNKDLILSTVRDITERKKAEEQIRIQRDLATQLAQATSLAEVLPTYIETALKLTSMDGAAIYIVDRSTGELRLRCHYGLSDRFLEKVSVVNFDAHTREAMLKEPLYYDAPDGVEMGIPFTVDCVEEGLRAIAALPISYKGEVVGSFNLASRAANQVPAATKNVLEMMVLQIGNVIQRINAEEELMESERKYRNIFQNAVEGIFQATPDGRFLSANPAIARIHGWDTPEEFMNSFTPFTKDLYVNPERRSELMSILKRDGVARNFEAQVYHRDGNTRWISLDVRAVRNERGDIILQEGTAEDITRQKQAEEALQESEAKYRSVVEESLAGFFILQDDLYKYVNKTFCDIHGYAYHEIVDRMGPWDFVPSEDADRVREDVRRRLEGIDSHQHLERRAVRKDGKIIAIKVFGTTMYYRGRLAATGTVLDITKEKSLEEQLLHSQKLEAIGQLAGGIAHDFNNILSAIIGYGSLIQMKMAGDDPLRLYLDQILNSSHKAAQLTQSLLAFSRKQLIRPVPQRIDSIIAGVEGLLKRLLTEDIELKISSDHKNLTVLADVTQIDQVLINLATNARDAMPKGGKLTIKVKPFTMSNNFIKSRGFGHPGLYALISMADSGTGIDESARKRIFEPFFTTKEVGKGTGLGLAIVYGIVKQHSGFIDVQSESGKGTTFDIYLPVVPDTTDETEAIHDPIARGTETILVAEDNEELRYLMRTVLTSYGYKVIEAADGDDAVSKYVKEKQNIDLVILDVVMPKKNGREAYDEIRAINHAARVLFMSGYTDDIVHEKGMLNRDLNFLAKPASPAVLLRRIRETLDARQGGLT
jgi:PAS domain S-box-containing protein